MQVDQLIGRQIDHFTIRERIGQGGMATVYRATQMPVNRDVALKIISLDSAQGAREDFRRRFANEAELIASLEHIHILPVYDYGIVADDIAYIAMRLLRGGSLAGLLQAGKLDLNRAADLFTQMARGLAYAHRHNVIHRDIKPSNILLDDTGNAYLTDFGLARLVDDSRNITHSGSIVGTPAYMSPEQLRGDTVDHRSDIYSLGVVLYHMLTGQPPFQTADNSVVSIIYHHLEKSPRPPSELNNEITPEIEAVILRALAKAPAERFDTADEMPNALNTALGRKQTTATFPALPVTPIPTTTVSAVKPRRRWLPYAVGVSIALFAVLVGAAYLLTRTPPPHPATVLADKSGSSADAVPSADEIQAAQARVGSSFIAYITCNQTSEYHATQAREMGDLAAKAGLAYRIYDSNNDKSRQIPLIEKARSDGAVGLIICPLDTSLLDGALKSAQDAGIPLVFMHADIDTYGGVRLAGDDYLMGRKAGEAAGQLIRDQMGGKADVIILDYPDLPPLVERANGLQDGVLANAPEAHIIGRFLGATKDNGEASVSKLIAQNVHFDVITSINDAGSFGAIAALEKAGIPPGRVNITSIDAETLAREYIRSGHYLRASVDVGRAAFSSTAVDAMIKLLAGSTLPETFLVPPGDLVTASTLSATATKSS